MNRTAKIALDTLRLAEKTLNALNGMRKAQARKFVNDLIHPFTKGIFRDESWRGVRDIWDELDRAGIDWHIEDNFYNHDDRTGVPISKTWKFEVEFKNEKGRPTTLYGICVAAGAGSVEQPLEKYDVTAYVS